MSSELTAYERERRKQMAAHAKMLESTGIEAQREELRTACAPKPKSIQYTVWKRLRDKDPREKRVSGRNVGKVVKYTYDDLYATETVRCALTRRCVTAPGEGSRSTREY